MASIAFRPSSSVLVTPWCAHVGSLGTLPAPPLPSPPRARRAAMRAVAARSFCVESGLKLRMRGETSSVTPTSRQVSAMSRSDSSRAACCASAVLLWSRLRSRAETCSLPLASRQAFSLGLEKLHAHLQLVRLVERGADLLHVRLGRDVQDFALDKRHFAVHLLVRHLHHVRRDLDPEEARKEDEESRHLVARDVRLGDALGDQEVDRECEAALVE
eukprot:5243407-Prymnesium_polylepis.1